MYNLTIIKRAKEKIRSGYFGAIHNWASNGLASIAVDTVLGDEVYRNTFNSWGGNKEEYRDICGLIYHEEFLTGEDGVSRRKIFIDNDLLQKIKVVVPECAKKLQEAVDALAA